MKPVVRILSKRWIAKGLLVAALLAMATMLASCGGGGATDDTDTTLAPNATTTEADQASTDTTASGATTTVRVYFPVGQSEEVPTPMGEAEKIYATSRVIPQTQAVGAAAMKALLEGPTQEEQQVGMFSCIPTDTEFLGLNISDGIAYVDLSSEFESGGGSLSMLLRWGQVVFTLTQFPTVDGVRLKLDGELRDYFGGEGIMVDTPWDRDDCEDMSPAILVESPTIGQTVSSPLRVRGTSNVFEAQSRLSIVDWDGRIIAEALVTATSGTGTRGTFDITVTFDVDQAGRGALIVFDDSMEDGSPIDVVEIPLWLSK